MNQYDKYIGTTFDDRFKIIKRIGEGGMAVVFEAFDNVENKIVAVKVLKEEIANDSQSVKRFINESKAVSMMSHPNIVKIYNVSVKDDLKYIAMEYIDGVTLKSYMTHKGRLSMVEALSYTEQILRALEHAHAKGVTHRDIKPQNILLLKDGKIKVTDFGIAKLPNAETVTMTDKAIGTVYYISPEQASGKPIDSRSDLYSLGVMMYEMLTGELPFNAESPVTVALMQVSALYKPPREINPEIPVGLEQIIDFAMKKNPDERFQSARQMLTYLIQIRNNPSYVFKLPLHNPAAEGKQPEANKKPAVKKAEPVKKTKREELEKEEGKKKKRGTPMFPIILGITLAFLIVAAISAWVVVSHVTNINADEEPVNVTVPNLVGKLMTDDLRAGLDASGFRVIISYDEEDTSSEANIVLSQSPDGDSERSIVKGKQYIELKVTLSRGENSITLSDYTVTDYREVKLKLEEMGLNVLEEHEYNDNIPLGKIIRTVPRAGEVVSHGGTVTLYISRGAKVSYVQVPQLVGLSEDQAKSLLAKSGIELGKVTYESSSSEKGIVLRQSREAYETVIANSFAMDLVVSSGSE